MKGKVVECGGPDVEGRFLPELGFAAGYRSRCYNGLGKRFENVVVSGNRCEEESGRWVVWGAEESKEGIFHLADLLLGRVRRGT